MTRPFVFSSGVSFCHSIQGPFLRVPSNWVFCVKRVRSTRELADGAFERVRDVLHAPGLHPLVPFGREAVAWALPTADAVIRLPLATPRPTSAQVAHAAQETETQTREGDADGGEQAADGSDDSATGEQRVANALTSDAVPVAYEARMICVRSPQTDKTCLKLFLHCYSIGGVRFHSVSRATALC